MEKFRSAERAAAAEAGIPEVGRGRAEAGCPLAGGRKCIRKF